MGFEVHCVNKDSLHLNSKEQQEKHAQNILDQLLRIQCTLIELEILSRIRYTFLHNVTQAPYFETSSDDSKNFLVKFELEKILFHEKQYLNNYQQVNDGFWYNTSWQIKD